jgi:polyhydroxybutyrate depolymerase
VPVITFHGPDDAIVRFNGGFGSIPRSFATPTAADLNGPGIPAYVAGTAARNGCDPTPTDTQLTDEVIHRVYQCPTDADVEFYIVVGGGHTWPGSEFSRAIAPVVGYTTFDIDASQLAWEFFEQFQLPCPDDVVCEDEPDSPSTSTTTSTATPSTASLASASVAAAGAVAPSFTG